MFNRGLTVLTLTSDGFPFQWKFDLILKELH
jgi:hypothetical protein